MNPYPPDLEVIRLDRCDSTNNHLKNNYRRYKERLPILVTSSLQEAGRGRDQRTWVSPPGLGLYTSVSFAPKTHENLFLLALIAAVGVIETLETLTGVSLSLKWPNDILYDGRKLAGILIENSIFGDEVFCVVGMGINLNHAPEDFPPELRNRAVSLKTAVAAGEDFLVEDINPLLAVTLFEWLKKLNGDPNGEVVKAANWFSRGMKGRSISFHQLQGGQVVSGIFRGINPDGGLRLEDEKGTTSIYYSGEIGA